MSRAGQFPQLLFSVLWRLEKRYIALRYIVLRYLAKS